MKRFTETTKWDDPWFRALSPTNKLVFLFLVENCNNAGFYEIDLGAMAFKTGLTESEIEGAMKGLARGIVGASDWLWVRQFLKHQKNSELNPENPAHKQILGLLSEQVARFSNCEEFQRFLAPLKGLKSPIGISIGTGTGKGSPEGAKSRFTRPALEEAIAYGAEISMQKEQVESWYDHFEANGWKISGKTPMQDWKASLRNGKRNAPRFSMSGVNGITANKRNSSF